MISRFTVERGVVLIVVLAVILTLLVLGSVFMRLMGAEAMISENLEMRTRALYLAESGVNVGIVFLQDNPNWPVVLPVPLTTYPMAGGTVSYRIDTTSAPNRALVVGTGQVEGAERVLEVTVSR